MGYFDYLCEKHPDVAEANKDKKAEITGIRFDGTDEELSAEYFIDDTSVKVNLADAAMQPGEARTLIVPDVDKFPGHIACSSLSRSEIVVPVYFDGVIKAVLDIDSKDLGTFDETDAGWLEKIVNLLH
jgi:hypothetical protein